MRIGYGRVFTRDQHRSPTRRPDRRRLRTGLPRHSLGNTRPPARTRQGSTLGRSVENLIELSNTLQGRGVDLVVLDQGIDASSVTGRMFFQILGSIAEFDHALMSERTRDGLAAARACGRTGGQKPKPGPRQVRLARGMYEEKNATGKRAHTVAHIAEEFGVTRPTIYRHLAKP